MKLGPALLLVLSFACSSDPGGVLLPFGDVPASGYVSAPGLDGPTEVVRDKFGVPHVIATSIADAAFAQGYIEAADRLPQMNLFRHVASGTISELFGALDRNQIDGDLRMRMHMFRPIAQKAYDQMKQSGDPIDAEVVRFLDRFSDGVNQYLSELQAGKHDVDHRVATFFDPARTEPWNAVDSLTIGRLEAWSQDYSADQDISDTLTLQKAQQVFNSSASPARAARAGLWADLYQARPMDLTATIDDYPSSGHRRTQPAPRTVRPLVDEGLLRAALDTVKPTDVYGLRIRSAFNGSNNWVVSPQLAGGKPMLANDPHLELSNPSILYFIHLSVPGQLEAAGMTLPGVPGIILGHNGHVAWGGTDVFHDVADVYQETIVPCSSGGGDCVMWKGREVKIETRQETLKIAALETGNETLTVTYEVVPHHGPIIPIIQNHTIVPRTGSTALSVRYTGYEVTNEVRAAYKLMKSKSLDEAFAALEDWSFGGLNWVVIDDAGNIGWYPHAHIPWRTTPGCFTWSAHDQNGVGPLFVVPGDGSCEWEGYFDSASIPKSKNPAKGFLATANADPVGATFDGDPFNEPVVGGHMLYISGAYDPGYREGRITRDLMADAARGPIKLDDLAAIQADTHSNFGESMRPYILAALTKFGEELANPGAHPDLHAWVSSLSADQRTRLMSAMPLLGGWSLETPAATDPQTDQSTLMDSAATCLFNAWSRHFLSRAFGDELALLDDSIQLDITPRAGLAVFQRPTELLTGLAQQTGEPLLCDDLTTTQTESCTLDALEALDDAFTEMTTQFNSGAFADWRWGKLHTVTLQSQLPDRELDVPPPDDPTFPNGYPRHGDNFSVDASNPGLSGGYAYGSGPVMRHLTEFLGPGQPHTRMALPGGEVFDQSSPHYRDLMDQYWSQNRYFEFAWTDADLHKVAESRIQFAPQ